MRTTIIKRIATAAVVAVLPLSVASCAKGGSTGSSTDSQSSGAGGEVLMWTHNAGNKNELAAIEKIVADYNASQSKHQVKVQAFPQDSYNQSVVAAAAAKKLPCLLDIDGPNVPNWAWAGYLAPIEGLDDTLNKYLPSTVGTYDGKTYAYGYYDVALTMVTRKSVLEKYDIRIPTLDQPWTKDEFDGALAKIKASGDFDHPLDIATSFTGEWWPYAYSPMLQSFGGDLINRTDYKTADGALNGPQALAWAQWFRGLVTNEYIPLKSGADPAKDFVNGKSAILYNGTWTATDTRKAFGDDTLFLPPPNFGTGAKIGGGSWQWGQSATCGNAEGAADYLKFAAQDKYVASVATATTNIPTTEAAAAETPGYGKDGDDQNAIFREYAQKLALVRPVTPGYPFIATTFTKTAQDILNGADPQQALGQAVKDIDENQETNNNFQ